MFPLVDDIKKAFPGVECRMTNDANAATIGEMIYSNAKDEGFHRHHARRFRIRRQWRDDLRPT